MTSSLSSLGGYTTQTQVDTARTNRNLQQQDQQANANAVARNADTQGLNQTQAVQPVEGNQENATVRDGSSQLAADPTAIRGQNVDILV